MATGSESQNNLVPCFIKIVPEDIDNQKSGIMPPSFKKIIGKEYPRSIGLRGPSIRTMRMIVDKGGDEIVLWWKNFLDTNRIRPSNFVLFRYLGNMYFNVQVFDASGVERLHKPWPENHQDVVGTSNEKKKRRPKQCERNAHAKQKAEEGTSLIGRKRGRPRKNYGDHPKLAGDVNNKWCIPQTTPENLPCFGDEENNEEARFSREKGKVGRPRKIHVGQPYQSTSTSSKGDEKSKSCIPSSGNLPTSGDEENKDASFPGEKKKRGRPRKVQVGQLHQSTSGKAGAKPNDKGKRKKRIVKTGTNHKFSRTYNPTEEQLREVQERSKSFTSDYPYYTCCMNAFNVQSMLLHIDYPTDCQPFFPPQETKIVLRNSDGEGKGWEVKVIPGAGKHIFSGGWRYFVLDNDLKCGDICVFEVVSQDQVRVHIYRCG